ncbi:SEP2, partial [Symbiodinium pilosum]
SREQDISDHERYRGRIKSWGPGTFGFIECPELASRFKRDVYVSQAEYKDWAIGAPVSFSLVVTEQRKPQARDVREELDSDGSAPSPASIGRSSADLCRPGTQDAADEALQDRLEPAPVSRTSSQSSQTLPGQWVRTVSTSWADIVDEEEDLLGHLAREAMHLPYYEQLMSLLAVTWKDLAPALAPAGMEPPESETGVRDCASLIKEYKVDAGLQGFQRSYALETAIADQHGESMQGPAAQAEIVEVPTQTYLEQQGSRLLTLPLTYRTRVGEDVIEKTPDAWEGEGIEGFGFPCNEEHQVAARPAELPPAHHPVPKRAMHVRMVQATVARVHAACAAAAAAKQCEALEERKKLLGLPPLDEAPPKPAWPSSVVQPRHLQPWSGSQAQGMQASAGVLAQPQTGVPKPPSGPPPAKLQEPPGPPTEPQSGLSANAPAFQPGYAWHQAPPTQCPVATYPCPEHGDQRCHQVPLERGNILSMTPSVQAHPFVRARTPLHAAQHEGPPLPLPPSQSSDLGPRPVLSQTQQAARHGGPAPAQRRQYEERPAPHHHQARNSRPPDVPNTQRQVAAGRRQRHPAQEAETGHWQDSWGQQEWQEHEWHEEEWHVQDWQAEWWREDWRGPWSDWAASLGQKQGSKGGYNILCELRFLKFTAKGTGEGCNGQRTGQSSQAGTSSIDPTAEAAGGPVSTLIGAHSVGQMMQADHTNKNKVVAALFDSELNEVENAVNCGFFTSGQRKFHPNEKCTGAGGGTMVCYRVEALQQWEQELKQLQFCRQEPRQPPLHYAAMATGAGALNALLKAKAPLTVRDARGQSLLHAAARSGSTEALRRLLQAIRDGRSRGLLEWSDRWARSAVHWAALNGHPEVLKILLEAKAPLLADVPHGVAGAVQLTERTWAGRVSGKTVFVNFHTEWCNHCKMLKPTWDKLANAKFKFKEKGKKKSILIASVDCSGDASKFCLEFGVDKFPTLKYGSPYDLDDYTGKKELRDLENFVTSQLTPVCTVDDQRHCSADEKLLIKDFQRKSILDLDKIVEKLAEERKSVEADYSLFKANLLGTLTKAGQQKDRDVSAASGEQKEKIEADFRRFVDGLTEQHNEKEEEKNKKLALLKAKGLSLARNVQANRKPRPEL